MDEKQGFSFWADRIARGSHVLMDGAQIKDYNFALERRFPRLLSNIGALSEQIDGGQLRQMLLARPLPVTNLFRGGHLVHSAYKDTLAQRMNLRGIQKLHPVQFGVTHKRTDLRSFPTSDAVFFQPDLTSFDRFQESALAALTPVAVFHTTEDKQWLFGGPYFARGWLAAKDVFFFRRRSDFLDYTEQRQFLTVLAPRMFLPIAVREASIVSLSVKLPLDKYQDRASVMGQSTVGNYTIDLIHEGNRRLGLVPLSADVCKGWVPFTRHNILRLAFKMQGQAYGWGGSEGRWDCSSFIQDVFSCFGFRIPRNSSGQEQLLGRRVPLSGLSAEDTADALDQLAPGALLFFPGHVMMYIGSAGGKHYALHAIAVAAEKINGAMKEQPMFQIMVTDLWLRRAGSGRTFLSELTTAIEISANSA